MLRRVTYLLDGRLFEWSLNAATLWLAYVAIRWPNSITIGAFKHLTDFIDGDRLAILALILGVSGQIALIMNGRSFIVGPVVRSTCAVGRAFIWSQMGYSLYLLGLQQEAPSIGFGFWVIFTLSELYVAYRAMIDVQRAI